MIIPLKEPSNRMKRDFLLDPVRILKGPKEKIRNSAVLVVNSLIKAFGNDARHMAKKMNILRV